MVSSDQASEEIAEKFLSGETNLDKFLSDYLESRKVRYTRNHEVNVEIDYHNFFAFLYNL